MNEAIKLLASLEDRIKTQLSYEYHDAEEQQYQWDSMTVPRLLNMLAYIMEEES